MAPRCSAVPEPLPAWQAWCAADKTQAATKEQSSSVPTQHPLPDLKNLILVACHAVFVGSDYREAEEQASWLLLDYQKVEHYAFLAHTLHIKHKQCKMQNF